ncbi:7286_t:CDS:2 [Cetraspora pellucida]|uniref:7286_t:CDS:1 n=1 Tax=Cetraspora pellucida TaxID=1433469 RepID=A0ACA9KKC1_9GLOM|nr:7286_t:CDS:2 [Cetraspora pellucida]
MHQIYYPSPKNTPYASYSRISKPNCVYQCDLIEILYDENDSLEVVDAFRNIYKKPNNPLTYSQLLQYDEDCSFIECERFARRIVDNMNVTPTWLIGMSPNSAIKLKQVYSKPSAKYYHPVDADKSQLPKRTISPSLHKIQKIVVRKNLPMSVLYYLNETGPQCSFVREKLMHIKEEPILPPRWVLEDNQMHSRHT